MRDSVPGPWDRDLSWRQILSQLSHPGAPGNSFTFRRPLWTQGNIYFFFSLDFPSTPLSWQQIILDLASLLWKLCYCFLSKSKYVVSQDICHIWNCIFPDVLFLCFILFPDVLFLKFVWVWFGYCLFVCAYGGGGMRLFGMGVFWYREFVIISFRYCRGQNICWCVKCRLVSDKPFYLWT